VAGLQRRKSRRRKHAARPKHPDHRLDGSDLAGSGINPIANGSSPIRRQWHHSAWETGGVYPEPLGNGTISPTVSGLTANAQYYLHYYENARTGAGVPSIEVQLNGATIVPTHPVAPVGGGNLYREV